MRHESSSLTAMHERGTFDCGKPPLNAFIRQHASVNHERGVSRVYVAVRGTDQRVHRLLRLVGRYIPARSSSAR